MVATLRERGRVDRDGWRGIYLRQVEKLIAMAEQPHATEDILEKLPEDYPELLAGDEVSAEPRREAPRA